MSISTLKVSMRPKTLVINVSKPQLHLPALDGMCGWEWRETKRVREIKMMLVVEEVNPV